MHARPLAVVTGASSGIGLTLAEPLPMGRSGRPLPDGPKARAHAEPGEPGSGR